MTTTSAPYFDDGQITLYCGDCRGLLADVKADAVVTDPPYGDTSLTWDEPVRGWLGLVDAPQVWCFGSMRFWLEHGAEFDGWTYGQEIVWEKHNGSGFHADRFKRVHELVLHFYRGTWGSLYHETPTTNDATARTVRRKKRPPHMGHIEASSYVSKDGGPRLMRSVQYVRSEHGRAVHPTQKPLEILQPLIEYSCPVDGLVLDPFAGAGSTLVAARDAGRRAIGIEIGEAYCEATVARLAQGRVGGVTTTSSPSPAIRVDKNAAEAAVKILYRSGPLITESVVGRARNVLRTLIEQSENAGDKNNEEG